MFVKYFAVFFISMLPLIELRGAIPFSQAAGLPFLPSFIVSIAGNVLPVPVIYLFARRFLVWGQNKKLIGRFCSFCLLKGESAGKRIQAKTGGTLFFALVLFVGIPLPGTGAWTGTLAASILDMDFKRTVLAVIFGVVLAGVIMMLASLGVLGAVSALFSPR